MEFSAAVLDQTRLARHGKLFFIRRADHAYLRELKCSFRRNVKRRTDTNSLTIAAWGTAGHFAAVQQYRIGFHFEALICRRLRAVGMLGGES